MEQSPQTDKQKDVQKGDTIKSGKSLIAQPLYSTIGKMLEFTWYTVPGTVSTVQDTRVGSFLIVEEVLSLLGYTAFFKHGIWYVIVC